MSHPVDNILQILESKDYLTSRNNNSEYVKDEIIKFTTWLSKVAKFSFLACNKDDKKEYLSLLSNLKRNVRDAISSLTYRKAREQKFSCGLCDEEIIIEPYEDFWECLQSHSHFEEMNLNFLNRCDDSDETDSSFNNYGETDASLEVKYVIKLSEELDKVKIESGESRNSRQWYESNILENDDKDSDSTLSQLSLDDQEEDVISHPTVIGSKKLHQQQPAITFDSIQNIGKDQQNNNSFRFNFESYYDSTVEEILYPRVYQKFILNNDFIFQKTGLMRSVCLVCQCELLNKRNVKVINGHMSGHRHIKKLTDPNYAPILRQYHDTFMNMEPDFQAQQVYFVPDDDPSLIKCILCALYVKSYEIQSHILHDPHKSHVLRLRSNKPAVRNFFNLLECHLRCYGIYEENSAETSEKGIPNEPKQEKHTPKKPFNGGNRENDVKEHKIVKSIEDPSNQNPILTLPRRFAQHTKFLKLSGSSAVSCIACKNGKIAVNDLQHHLIQPSHLVSTKLSLQDYMFFCELCDMKFHDEITWYLHFRDKNNINKHENIAPARKNRVCEYECLPCKAIIYGDELSLRRHQSSYVRRNAPRKATVLSEDVKRFFASKKTIEDNSLKLLVESLKVIESQDNLRKCCEDLENALLVYYGYCKAHPFGSRVSGLGCEDSDLDVFIDIGEMYNGMSKQEDKCQIDIITTALEYFRKTKEFYRMTSIPTARTPIIKLKHRSTGLDCDISFRHGLSVENTKFLKFCFELQPMCRSLILLLKKWSSLCLLNENITTYAFAMMAIFYLQTKQLLVSVDYLKSLNPGASPIIDGWETISYDANPTEKVKSMIRNYDGTIVDLLKEFFKYYSDFNYATEVVCPLLGKTVLKSQFTEDLKGKKLPKEMAVYIKKININKDPELFRSLSEFCIQDPFDLSHNLTKACTKSLVDKFKRLCKLTFDILNKL